MQKMQSRDKMIQAEQAELLDKLLSFVPMLNETASTAIKYSTHMEVFEQWKEKIVATFAPKLWFQTFIGKNHKGKQAGEAMSGTLYSKFKAMTKSYDEVTLSMRRQVTASLEDNEQALQILTKKIAHLQTPTDFKLSNTTHLKVPSFTTSKPILDFERAQFDYRSKLVRMLQSKLNRFKQVNKNLAASVENLFNSSIKEYKVILDDEQEESETKLDTKFKPDIQAVIKWSPPVQADHQMPFTVQFPTKSQLDHLISSDPAQLIDLQLQSIDHVFAGCRWNMSLSNSWKSDIRCDQPMVTMMLQQEIEVGRVELWYEQTQNFLSGLKFFARNQTPIFDLGYSGVGHTRQDVVLADDEKVIGFRSAGDNNEYLASHVHFQLMILKITK